MNEQVICTYSDMCPEKCSEHGFQHTREPGECFSWFCKVAGVRVECRRQGERPVVEPQRMICPDANGCLATKCLSRREHPRSITCSWEDEHCPACVPALDDWHDEHPVGELSAEIERLRRKLDASRQATDSYQRIAIRYLKQRDAASAERDKLQQESDKLHACGWQVQHQCNELRQQRNDARDAHEETSENYRLALIESGQVKAERDELRRVSRRRKESADSHQRIAIRYLEQRDELQAENARLRALIANAAAVEESLNCGEDELEALRREIIESIISRSKPRWGVKFISRDEDAEGEEMDDMTMRGHLVFCIDKVWPK